MQKKYVSQLLLAMSLMGCSTMFAQSWTATTGGNWTTGTNWSSTPTAPANDGTAAIIFDVNATQTSTVDTPYSIASLTFGSASGGTITLGGASALTIGSGGIKNNMTISGGAVTISTPLTIGASQTWSTGDAVSYAVDRSVTVTGTITGTADKTITVSGTQDDTRNRNYTVSANNSATFAGNWVVDAGGRLALGSGGFSFGSGTITVNTGGKLGGLGGSSNITNNVTLAGGTLRPLGGGNGGGYSGNLDITANSFVEIPLGAANTGNITISNSTTSTLTGSGNLTTSSYGTGGVNNALTLGLSTSTVNATNTGTLTINATSRVVLSKQDNATAWGGNIAINNGGSLEYNLFRENQIGDTSTVTINTGGSYNLAHDSAQQLHEKISGLVVNAASNAFINDATTTARIILGSGTSATGTGGIFVNSTGTLSGTGTVNKLATIQGGVLAAGDNSVGTLTFSENLTFATGLAANSLQFTLGTTSDLVVVSATKTLDIGSGLLDFAKFQFTAGTGFGAGVYTLLDTSTTVVGTMGSGLTGTIGGFDATLSLANAGQDLILTVSAIPEPSTYAALVGVGILGFACFRRRQRV